MKALIFLAFIVTTSFAFADCSKFTGHYIVTSGDCMVERLSIAYKPATQLLTVAHNPHTGGYTATYIADGKEQSGDDMNSGARYVVSCGENTMMIWRKFSQIRLPIVLTFTESNGVLKYEETFEGDTDGRSCEFVRTK